MNTKTTKGNMSSKRGVQLTGSEEEDPLHLEKDGDGTKLKTVVKTNSQIQIWKNGSDGDQHPRWILMAGSNSTKVMFGSIGSRFLICHLSARATLKIYSSENENVEANRLV